MAVLDARPEFSIVGAWRRCGEVDSAVYTATAAAGIVVIEVVI